MKIFTWIATGGLIFLALAVFEIKNVGREQVLKSVFGSFEYETIDFSRLTLGRTPNQFLVCPIDFCKAKPDLISPIYDVPVVELLRRWEVMILAQPRIENSFVETHLKQYEYIQRSALMLFPDSITVRFIKVDENSSTLAIFSRSNYGKSDFSVNKTRILNWLSAL